MIRHAARATIALGTATLLLAGCGGEVRLAPEAEAKMRAAWDEVAIEREPLCIEAGPFPFLAGRGTCDHCQALAQAGMLVRRIEGDGRVAYDLSAEGRPLYRLAPDPELLDLIRRRFAQNRPGETMPPPSTWNKPRLCFGRTRFHSVAAALMPMNDGGVAYHSIKVVSVAEDTSGLLFDPRIAALGLPVPQRPPPGQPALNAPRIVTFQVVRSTGEYVVDDSVRYGAWVDSE
jgi:hypothetical protein